MPELGAVLAGMLADVVRARLAADALTAELVTAYGSDPLLSSMSVPRAAIKELTVTLRFAVDDFKEAPQAPVDVERVTEEWNHVLKRRVLPRVARAEIEGLGDRDRREVVARLEEHQVAVSAAELKGAVGGDVDALVAASVEQALNAFRALPTNLRRRIATIEQLRQDLDGAVRADLTDLLDRRKGLQSAQRAFESRLGVSVLAKELAERAPQEVQELSVTLTMADIETLGIPEERT